MTDMIRTGNGWDEGIGGSQQPCGVYPQTVGVVGKRQEKWGLRRGQAGTEGGRRTERTINYRGGRSRDKHVLS